MKTALAASPAARIRPIYRSTMEWLKVAQLSTDPRAQRVFDEGWAQHLATWMDTDKLGIPAVVALSERGRERFIVIDGQHRIAAIRMVFGDDKSVYCEVIRNVGLQRAAEIFRGRNAMRRPRIADLFLTGITAEDSECVAINDTVQKLGLSIGHRAASSTICAVASLQRIYRNEKALGDKCPNLLRRTLQLAVSAWGRDSDTFNGDVLRGLGLVLERYGSAIEVESLERKLRGAQGGALGLLGRARAIRDGVGGSVSQCVARVIVTRYNVGRRTNALAEWGANIDDKAPRGHRAKK